MIPSHTIRVVIVDDHDMVCRGVATYLSTTPDIALVGEAHDGSGILQLCDDVKPDVVLMDLVMDQVNGFEAIRAIKNQHPSIQIIALTNYSEFSMVKEALIGGVIAYLLKNVNGDDLVGAIRRAYAGLPTFSPEITSEHIVYSMQPQVGDNLTERERKILTLMTEGMTNPEIANCLSLSSSTIRAHVSKIFFKLGVTKRAEAVSVALRRKITK
jgi:DNA-binding NarL/FixJ family response regulator